MKIIYNVENYDGKDRFVIALGNFDGIHLAHRKILEETKTSAKKLGLKSAVLLLNPHPVQLLFPERSFQLLTSLEERAGILAGLGMDYLIVEQFTEHIARLSPFHFVRNYLVQTLNVARVVVGYDYTFGHRGEGTTYTLMELGKKFGFEVEIIPPVMIGGKVISSSLIRELIARGEIEKASEFLGAFFERKGKVIHGEGRGAILGFPTANLEIPGDLLLPANGVYLNLVQLRDKELFALTNVGKKPTFCTDNKTHVEVFLLDFNKDIYGQELTVRFLHRIRDEITFKDSQLLIKQIEQDLLKAQILINQKYGHLLEKQRI
ncbi:MAG: bifunctional riboflavin kinase/FAD synthetase [Firmicutes bacterium]|nr:bifunctional riboflavin kinase/FAD synthetase [Bacillota bacterium]